MKVTVDTSALLAVVLSEPARTVIVASSRGCDLIAPAVLPYEIGNALSALYRRKRLSASQVESAWQVFFRLPVGLTSIDLAAAISLATRHSIYAYDAYFIQAAIEQNTQLLTLDGAMQRAAGQVRVALRERIAP